MSAPFNSHGKKKIEIIISEQIAKIKYNSNERNKKNKRVGLDFRLKFEKKFCTPPFASLIPINNNELFNNKSDTLINFKGVKCMRGSKVSHSSNGLSVT